MATLEGLAVYWNSKTHLLQRMEQKLQMMDALKEVVLEENPELTYSKVLRHFVYVYCSVYCIIIFCMFLPFLSD